MEHLIEILLIVCAVIGMFTLAVYRKYEFYIIQVIFYIIAAVYVVCLIALLRISIWEILR